MVPQLIKAELLANFRIKLTFDNNEIRFLGTRNSKNFVEENTVLKNLFVAGELVSPRFQVQGKN
ncbi:hypothetical protein V6B05_03020 [Lactococcus garvieae]|uniref:hypothetical protein n=1 Tax=Lactococcus garvieae TaxID=1363 RepID=UPI001F60CC80|nr:hypothetical protein [Lactococcus garvieae]MCI3859536.1 hypothetical protein [Lactococcus garvieae]